MSYKLEKPCTDVQRADFIVEYNHNKGLLIEETDKAIYALEAWELLEGDEVIDNTEAYEAEQAQKERERINNLSMTRGDVFEALILAKGLGKTQIRAMIEQAELDEVTKALYLNRFDEALEFYRGYPIFDLLGTSLGITPEMLDEFFDTKDYHWLMTCTLTVNATPVEATVTGTGTYPYGSSIDVKVECEGYESYTTTVILTEDTVLDVELEKVDEATDDTDELSV